MQYNKIEIIPVIRLGTYVTNYDSGFNFNKLFKSTQKTSFECKIFVYKNLYLSIGNEKDIKNKSTYKMNIINSKLLDNVVYLKQTFEAIPLENFPFINNYDCEIHRSVIQYDNGINLITDKYLNNDQIMTFISIDNDEKLESILKIIKEIS